MNFSLWTIQRLLAFAMLGSFTTHLGLEESVVAPAVSSIFALIVGEGRFLDIGQ